MLKSDLLRVPLKPVIQSVRFVFSTGDANQGWIDVTVAGVVERATDLEESD